MTYFRENAVRYLVGQHEQDEEIKTTHCHLAIDYPYKRNSIEKQVKKYQLGGQGQFAIMEKTQKTKLIYDFDKLCNYILKGDKKHLRDTNQTEQFVSQRVDEWIVHDPGASAPDSSTRKKKADSQITQYKIINEVISYGIEQKWIVPSDFEQNGSNSIAPWHRKNIFKYMCTLLNKYQIRTSRNELERIYVTILRLCPETQAEMYESIHKNIFRT